MDEERQVTIQELLSDEVYKCIDIMDKADVTSEEHKVAFNNFIKSVESLLAANKQANENDLAWAKFEEEKSNKVDDKAELRKEVIRYVIDISGIIAPIAATLIKQKVGQNFAAIQMEKMCYYEENGTLRSYPGKTAWKLVENETKS